MASGLVLSLAPARAVAFHQAGVANCSGCHVTHTGEGGAVVGALLNAESPSDVCLTCHATSQGAVLGSDPLAPPPLLGAGNFVFLLEDELNDSPTGLGGPIPGDAAGHNVVAPGHSLKADARHTLSPGGGFPSSRLGCTSCHDPHGSASFRLLRGAGSAQPGTPAFAFPAPEAVGLGLRSAPESAQRHTAYRAGMSNWCANCHGRYHDQAATGFEHDSDAVLPGPVRTRYNEYQGDADPTGGIESVAYLPEVPFESADATTSSTEGPGPGSRMMCLTCHRAHASSGPAAGRWDFNVTLLAEDGRPSRSYAIPSPYLDPSQGPLCAKCHVGGESLRPQAPNPFATPPAWPTGVRP